MPNIMVKGSCSRELDSIRYISKKNAALLTDEKWKMFFHTKDEEIRKTIEAEEEMDVICLEILNKDNINVAKEIRKAYKEALILIIANEKLNPTEYVIPSVTPSALLIKPIEHTKLNKVIKELFELFLLKRDMNKEDIFVVSNKDGIFRIPHKRILYFEAYKKKINIITDDDVISFCGTLNELEEKLSVESDNMFIRCHKSFLINKSNVKSVSSSKRELYLTDNTNIPISNKKRHLIRKVLL